MKRARPYLLLIPLFFAACGDLSEYPVAECTSRGELGCACGPRNTCKTANDGTRLACIDSVCQVPICEPGAPAGSGCACGGETVCAKDHVCIAGLCEVDTGQTLAPPVDPACYTPCRDDLVRPDGTVVVCNDDGLLPGCIGDAICRQGSCVVPTGPSTGENQRTAALQSEAGSCSADAHCPDFQNCIQGQCYSDCDVDADCRGERVCHRNACRLTCSTSDDLCPAGTACRAIDGENGYCLPVAASEGPALAPQRGTFVLTRERLSFTTRATSASFGITNQTSSYEEFTLRKRRHTEYGESGRTVIRNNPLFWLEWAVAGDTAARSQELVVGVGPGETVTIEFGSADNPTLDRWDGEVEVVHPRLPPRVLPLSFARSPEGQWSGVMYYIANFPDEGLAEWQSDRSDRVALKAVGNAFIQRWGALRGKRISLEEFQAALIAMQTESWKWDSVRQRCPDASNPDPNVGCYLFDNEDGIAVYSDYLPHFPIPTGLVELPITLNIRPDSATSWSGKIVSSETLHFPGDPKVSLRFSRPADECTTTGTSCLNFIDGFNAQAIVGGRYVPNPDDDSCRPGFEFTKVPWLVPGFEDRTEADSVSGRRYREECRDGRYPFDSAQKALNLNAASANPIPDGAPRRRSLELIDGAMIDQQTIFVIFREHLPSFLDPRDPEGFSSYGYMLLQRSPIRVDGRDYEGNAQLDYGNPPDLPGPGCSQELVERVLGRGKRLTAGTAAALGKGVVTGRVPTDDPIVPIDPAHPEKVHYLCADTGYFNDGPARGDRVACPPESRVEFFTIQGQRATNEAIADHACQTEEGICRAGEPCEREGCEVGKPCRRKGNCGPTLEAWKKDTGNTVALRTDLVYRCASEDEVICSTDRFDLRKGKLFYPRETEKSLVFRHLDDDIAEAFRYKTRFRNRAGTSVGFAPQVCIGDAIPYCYDPAVIEEIRDRVDCATHVYSHYYGVLDNEETDEERGVLKEFLVRNFAYGEQQVFGQAAPLIIDGFERLNAELLVMMGDESFTSAFSSRFDLAGQKLANFEGDLFEPQGLSLSGGAGFEMYSLYQAVQYYQMSLDRFYGMSAEIWSSMGRLPAGQGFMTQASTSWLEKLIRASAQKTRAYSEIAKRYQGFNRPDLARRVVGRAYSQAYMESAILSQMMRRLAKTADESAQAQITHAVEQAQLTYRAALLSMRNVYQDISDDMTFYGIPPDYIPFPALGQRDDDAFSKTLARARDMARAAAEKERRALADSRSFDTDSALFQAELGRIRDEAEGALAEICGTFRVEEDGQPQIYPAIPKYAHLSERTRLLGDPCGLMGNGALHDAILELEVAALEASSIRLAHENLIATAADAQDLASEQCGRIVEFKDFVAKTDKQILRYQDGVRSLELVIDTLSNTLELVSNTVAVQKCGGTDCFSAAIGLGTYLAVAIPGNVAMAASKATIVGLEHNIAALENAKVQAEIQRECDMLNIETGYVVKDLMRQGAELELEALKAQYGIRLALSAVQKLRNDATSAMAGQEESEEMAINIEAARNDPNIRIYRNDAVAAADRTFFQALKEAYRATRVFEYYTSQSYAPRENLFLVRMIESGDITLEAYLDELEQSFVSFQESYGNPDIRVAIVSLRDDILRIPRHAETGVALSELDRSRQLRQKLADVNLLDPRGYVTMTFSTSVEELSPLTRNHKIRYIESEIVGDNVGDSLGRLYVGQSGTGVVRAVDKGSNYYAFPSRTAVLNPFFNGVRPLDGDIYRSERLRDRPYVNTAWSLIINQKDEKVNQDIDLGSLTDIRLYVYYTDFTEL